MEENFCLRFSQVAELIFDHLTCQDIVKCMEVSRDWNIFLTSPPRILLIRKIHKRVEKSYKIYSSSNRGWGWVKEIGMQCVKEKKIVNIVAKHLKMVHNNIKIFFPMTVIKYLVLVMWKPHSHPHFSYLWVNYFDLPYSHCT